MKHIQEPGSRQNFFARRYDWQTLLYREGGAMRNNAAHTIEQIIDLAGSDELPESHSCMEIWNSVGDAEDYMFATMKYSNGTVYEVEVNPSDAYADGCLFDIYGTLGTMKVYSSKIQYKYFDPEECPMFALEHKSLHNPDGSPAYCTNNIKWKEETIALDPDMMNVFGKCSSRFYHDWYEHLIRCRALHEAGAHQAPDRDLQRGGAPEPAARQILQTGISCAGWIFKTLEMYKSRSIDFIYGRGDLRLLYINVSVGLRGA